MIRKANVEDVPRIQKFVNFHAEKGEMLPRSVGDICDNIRDFFIYERNGDMLGCCALHVTWVNLAEIRSLVVEEEFRGEGIGKSLLNACLDDAKNLAIKKVFALTYKPEFFEKNGFNRLEKHDLPHKVWLECVKCVKFPDCDEIAVMREL
ncbi:N-acetyltransferase [Candidatus Poribacteria bacterium]|nr:N-acetyltransferase [Candidatus Poribacteria bacterium]